MDPITLYNLGKIRQQEFLEECQRDHEGYEVEGVTASLWKRLRVLVSASTTRNERPVLSQNSRLKRGEPLATSH